MTTTRTPVLAEGADREHCVSVKGGKVHEVTEWDDQGPDYVFPLCRTGSMTNSGTKYTRTTQDLSCTNCVANRERRRARQAQEAAQANQAPAETAEEAASPAGETPEPAVVEEGVRYVAEFESVKAAPGHKEMRLTIRVRGEADPVEFYALTYMPGWTAEGMCRLFGWRPLADELEYTGTRTFGEVERTVSSLTPAGLDARLAFREEIVARFAVRLATGLADHFRATFRLGRAYPIGWTYRVSYGAGARFGWVTAGGIMPERFTADTREAAEEQLRALDPTALPGRPDVSEYVSGLSTAELGRLFLALRNGDLTTLPEILTSGAPITGRQAVSLVERLHGQADEFETLQGEGGRFLGWTFRCGRLRSTRYGWITARGTVAQALEPYRSTAGDVLVYADRDDQQAAERTAVARSMTGRKLADNRCVHNRYARTDVQGDPVLACSMAADGDTFSVFDGEGERYDTYSCAVDAANEAARCGGWDDTEGADRQPFWAKLCPAHPFEVAGRCEECGQDTPDEDAPASLFVAGDLVVCADGVRRTVEDMAPPVAGEPERVIVEGGAEWIAANCRRANRDDLHAARTRQAAAAARVRTEPNTEDPQWRAALAELGEALDFLKLADPLYAHLREDEAKQAVATVHADAHDFHPFYEPADSAALAGWTFRTGHSSGARYGVVTAACQVSPAGLYEYRTTAERAHLYGREGGAGRS
jgi:hypothetical protein